VLQPGQRTSSTLRRKQGQLRGRLSPLLAQNGPGSVASTTNLYSIAQSAGVHRHTCQSRLHPSRADIEPSAPRFYHAATNQVTGTLPAECSRPCKLISSLRKSYSDLEDRTPNAASGNDGPPRAVKSSALGSRSSATNHLQTVHNRQRHVVPAWLFDRISRGIAQAIPQIASALQAITGLPSSPNSRARCRKRRTLRQVESRPWSYRKCRLAVQIATNAG